MSFSNELAHIQHIEGHIIFVFITCMKSPTVVDLFSHCMRRDPYFAYAGTSSIVTSSNFRLKVKGFSR